MRKTQKQLLLKKKNLYDAGRTKCETLAKREMLKQRENVETTTKWTQHT
jgi:hypothetical protein